MNLVAFKTHLITAIEDGEIEIVLECLEETIVLNCKEIHNSISQCKGRLKRSYRDYHEKKILYETYQSERDVIHQRLLDTIVGLLESQLSPNQDPIIIYDKICRIRNEKTLKSKINQELIPDIKQNEKGLIRKVGAIMSELPDLDLKDKLLDAFVLLNYNKQIKEIYRYLEKDDLCSFALYGSAESGPIWFSTNVFERRVGILADLSSDHQTTFKFGNHFLDLLSFVNTLRRSLKLPGVIENKEDINYIELAEVISSKLRTGPYLIRIMELNNFFKRMADEFMADFWNPLCSEIEFCKNKNGKDNFHKFLLMLVEPDNKRIKNHSVFQKDDKDNSNQTRKIAKLPPVKSIQLKDINSWVLELRSTWNDTNNGNDSITDFEQKAGTCLLDVNKGKTNKIYPIPFLNSLAFKYGYRFQEADNGFARLVDL